MNSLIYLAFVFLLSCSDNESRKTLLHGKYHRIVFLGTADSDSSVALSRYLTLTTDFSMRWFKYNIRKIEPALRNEFLLNENFINTLVFLTIDSCHSVLPNDSVTIFIRPAKPRYLHYLRGVTEITLDNSKIVMLIDITAPDWKKMLPYNVAHEWNHAYWLKNNKRNLSWTLLDQLVLEGKADYFARTLYPGQYIPWVSLPDSTVNKHWQILWDKLDTANGNLIEQVMFGSDVFPRWTGYSIGYRMVSSAMQRERQSLQSCVKIAPAEMLQKSKFALP